MATCTITLEDRSDGGVAVHWDFDPPLLPGNETGVHVMACRALLALRSEDGPENDDGALIGAVGEGRE